MEHQLNFNNGNYSCSICQWSWVSKPKNNCPGTKRYSSLEKAATYNLYSELTLKTKYNRKPKKEVNPQGCIYFHASTTWIDLWHFNDTEILDPDLPPIIKWQDRGELLTIAQLRKINLQPTEEAKPRAVVWMCDKYTEEWDWVYLYHPENCQWEARDNYLSKKTLKNAYLLSDSWIKRLGSPDKTAPNPHGRHEIKLYSRKRVESFLAQNADEYAQWLSKRDLYLEIAAKTKPARDAANAERQRQKQLIAEQTARCLKCASSAVAHNIFLCAVHPSGFPYIPCSDFQPRR